MERIKSLLGTVADVDTDAPVNEFGFISETPIFPLTETVFLVLLIIVPLAFGAAWLVSLRGSANSADDE